MAPRWHVAAHNLIHHVHISEQSLADRPSTKPMLRGAAFATPSPSPTAEGKLQDELLSKD